MDIGDIVLDSPRGPGTITGITDALFPQVDHVAVTWVRCEDYTFDPYVQSNTDEAKQKDIT
jgi:hypothetical protein